MSNERDRDQEQGPADAGPIIEVRSASGNLTVTAAGQTDIGCERKINQDTLGNRVQQYADHTDDLGLLYAVADGMGGHVRGEVASAMAIDNLFALYYAADPTGDPAQTLARTMIDTNDAVFRAGPTEGARMGTTLTVALLRGDRLYVGNIGDSRTYRIRDRQIEQLSRDHSLIGEQVRSGLLSAEEARHSNIRNVITRALGYREEVEPDTFVFPVEPGDIILLCSDGLHGLVEDDELARVVGAKPLGVAIAELIDLARQRGGHDNITALAVRVETPGTPASDDGNGTAGTGVAATDGQATQPFTVVNGSSGAPVATATAVDDTRPADTAVGHRAAGNVAAPAAEAGGAETITEQVRTLTEPSAARAATTTPALPLPAYGASPPPVGPVVPAPPAVAPAAPRGAPTWPFVLIPLVLLGLAVGAILAFRAWTAVGPGGTPDEPPLAATAPPSTIPAAPGTAPLLIAPTATMTANPTAVSPGVVAEAASTTVPVTRVAAVGAPAEGTAAGQGEANFATIVGSVTFDREFLPPILARGTAWEILLLPQGDVPDAEPVASRELSIESLSLNLPNPALSVGYEINIPNYPQTGPYMLLIRNAVDRSITLPCSETPVMTISPGRNQQALLTIDCLPEQRQS